MMVDEAEAGHIIYIQSVSSMMVDEAGHIIYRMSAT